MNGQKFSPLVVIAVGLLVYHNSFSGAFVHDDFRSIPDNPTIRHLWPIWQCLSVPHRGGLTVEGRPLINFSVAVNYALGGCNVWGYHALNLTVHILAGLALLGIVRRTLLQPLLRDRFGTSANELALATAVLWTVHPLQTESVTYIIQRAESIMGLFYLLTLYCFVRGVESPQRRLWYGLSVTACALGMASKEVMVTAPLMVMLYDRTFVSCSFREAWRRRWGLYLFLASTWILLGFVMVSAGNFATASMNARRIGFVWWKYLATEPGVILYYLRLSVWPSPLRLDRGWPIARTWVEILPPTVVVAGLLAASIWALRSKPTPPRVAPAWGFGGAWFFLILAPSSSFIALMDPIYEHRMYLSLAAVAGLTVLGLYSLVGRRSLAVFMAVAIGFGFLTWRRNQDYRSEITLWADAAAKFPNDPGAHCSLGVALLHAGRHLEAIGQFEQAVRINPDHAQSHNIWGCALERAGKVNEAISHYEQALRIMPDYPEAQYNLGSILARMGRLQEAIGHYEQAVRTKPDFAAAHNNLGTALLRQGNAQEAIEHYEHALRIEPDDADTHYNLGLALEQTGRERDAIGHYEQILRLNPGYVAAQNRLARVQTLQLK